MAPISAMSGIYPQLEQTLVCRYAMLYVRAGLHIWSQVKTTQVKKKVQTFLEIILTSYPSWLELLFFLFNYLSTFLLFLCLRTKNVALHMVIRVNPNLWLTLLHNVILLCPKSISVFFILLSVIPSQTSLHINADGLVSAPTSRSSFKLQSISVEHDCRLLIKTRMLIEARSQG